ncbi:hypothetical protein SNEBB_005412 [Seison nebaliae]|nr:hypothetical protein SNEBB_005412 [Seison nebaliae]
MSWYSNHRRIVVVVLAFFALVFIHAMRTNISVIAVGIVHNDAHAMLGSSKAKSSIPRIKWTPKELGIIHCVFYIGYTITHLPGGFLATRFPSAYIMQIGVLLSAILNLFVPIAINKSFSICIVIRIVQGLAEGTVYPATYVLLSQWIPKNERGRMGGITYTGVYAGAILGYLFGGPVAHYLGFNYLFYFSGLVSIVWVLVAYFLLYSTPRDDPNVTAIEMETINAGTSLTTLNVDDSRPYTPWKEILTSLPVWSIALGQFARSWVFFLMLSNEPVYLSLFNFNLATNGVLSSLPHIVMVITAFTSGFIADAFIIDWRKSITLTRKVFTATGFSIEAISLLVLGFIRTGPWALVCLSIGIGMSGLTVSGWQINHLDLTKRHTGIVAGFGATIGNFAGILSPFIAGVLTKHQTLEQWRLVFVITSCIIIVCTLFYLLFGSGERQQWDHFKPSKFPNRIKKMNSRGPTYDEEHNVNENNENGFHERLHLNNSAEKVDEFVPNPFILSHLPPNDSFYCISQKNHNQNNYKGKSYSMSELFFRQSNAKLLQGSSSKNCDYNLNLNNNNNHFRYKNKYHSLTKINLLHLRRCESVPTFLR